MTGETNIGSGAKIFAVISVTYPEGSTCTCSNGTKTFKAKNTSGKALFNVFTGTWTVTVTDSERTISKNVSITSEGQYESMELRYNAYLYNKGNEYTNITGGLKTYTEAHPYGGSSAAVSKNKNNVTFEASRGGMPGAGHATGYLYTAKPLNLKHFKKIRVVISDVFGSGEIAVYSKPPSSSDVTTIASASFSSAGTKSLMIDNIESGYVSVSLSTGAYSGGQSGSMTIIEIECMG